MAITWADVVVIAPELSTVAAGIQTAILADAEREVDPDRWGEFADKGTKYLAAHLATIANATSAGISGPVTSETLGPMSRSYNSQIALEAGLLASTRYGVEYCRIRRIAVGPGVLVA